MCGIVGYIGPREAVEFLISGLHRLEYRGYDSAGVAVIDADRELKVVKSAGRIERLEAKLAETPLTGSIGIGHTRWATHGAPNDINSHPHVGGDGTVVLTHNGVIENFRSIKVRLENEGYVFVSNTDTEVIAHLIDNCLKQQKTDCNMKAVQYEPLVTAVQTALAQLQGTYGLTILSAIGRM